MRVGVRYTFVSLLVQYAHDSCMTHAMMMDFAWCGEHVLCNVILSHILLHADISLLCSSKCPRPLCTGQVQTTTTSHHIQLLSGLVMSLYALCPVGDLPLPVLCCSSAELRHTS